MPAPSAAFDPIRLAALHRQWARVLTVWLALGLAAVLLWPEARGQHAWIGWWPFWLVLAPLSSLLVLAARRRAAAVPRRVRVATAVPRPARRPRVARAGLLRQGLAALLPRG